jgi:hypothetical protein
MNTIRLEKLNPDQRRTQMKATGMKRHRTDFYRHCIKIIAVLAVCAGLPTAQCTLAETVVCDETTLSVNASDMSAEDLLKAVGETCGIRMLLRGEVFTDDVFSVQFESMPVRTGLERILRVVNIPNHMMQFEETASLKRVMQVDLIGKRGGERELTPGSQPATQDRATRQSPAKTKQAPLDTAKTELEQQQEEERQEKIIEQFEEILDEQLEKGNKPAPDKVIEMLQQALPEEMQGQIPEEVLEELEEE